MAMFGIGDKMETKSDRWKRAQGTYREDRSTGEAMELPPERPVPPKSLRGDALQEWYRVVPALESAGVLAAVDRAVLVAHCRSVADYERFCATLDAEGEVVDGKYGPVSNPLCSERDRAFRRMIETSKQLGLSPKARKTVRVKEKPTAKPGNVRKLRVVE